MTNYDELVKRLREAPIFGGAPLLTLQEVRQAAAAITRLQADLKEAVEALMPFSRYEIEDRAIKMPKARPEIGLLFNRRTDDRWEAAVTVGDFRRAAVIVAKHEGENMNG